MKDFLDSILKTVLFVTLTIVGLCMAFIFMLSTAIALGVMYIVARVRGQRFSAGQFWTQSRSKARQTQTDFQSKFTKQKFVKQTNDVTDVEMREIK
ncbi:MAG: hypothetical protein GX070_06570 [Alcaligenaceae bacterium]|nr:hypothetical protein [Alcaligenaceae bacterium]